MTDAELREFIEGWIPIHVKDAQHVKQAKLEARKEFVQLIKARDAAIRIDELKRIMQIPFITQHVYYDERVAELRRESDLGRRKDKEEE